MKARNFSSLRDLSLKIDSVDDREMQRFGRGEVAPGFLKLLNIVNGLGITFTQFAEYYDGVTEKDIQHLLEKLDRQSKKGRPQSVKPKPRKKKK